MITCKDNGIKVMLNDIVYVHASMGYCHETVDGVHTLTEMVQLLSNEFIVFDAKRLSIFVFIFCCRA